MHLIHLITLTSKNQTRNDYILEFGGYLASTEAYSTVPLRKKRKWKEKKQNVSFKLFNCESLRDDKISLTYWFDKQYVNKDELDT